MPAIRLGPFELLSPLGRGAMGEVWHAVHVEQGLPVAVKILTVQGASDERFRQALHTEIRSVAGLDHPGIVWLLDHGEVDRSAARHAGGLLAPGAPWLVMELATGGSLADVGPLSWARLRSLLLAILDALAHAHARGIVHRDLKAANVLIGGPEDLRPGPKLADFGIARLLDRPGDADQGMLHAGTLQYMPPEQIRGDWRAFGPWTDLYALGCMVHRLVAGRPPFAGRKGRAILEAHLSEPAPPLVTTVPGLAAWASRLLQKAPADRFLRAAEAAAALLRLPELGPGELAADAPATPVELTALGPLQATVDLSASSSGSAPTQVVAELASRPVGVDERPERLLVPSDWRRRRTLVPLPLRGAGLGLQALREPPLVDRDDERARMWKALRACRADGSPNAILLTGPSGVGKSRLARWCAERAHEVGAASVLRTTPTDDGLATWLRCQQLSATDLRGHLRVRDGEAFADDVVRLLEDDLAVAARAATLGRILEARSARRLVVWWVDAPDADRLDLVGRVLDRVDGPVLFLVTIRRDVDSAGVDALAAREAAHEIVVPPLDRVRRGELVASLLALEPALAAEVERRSEGLPGFAVELARDWAARDLLAPGPSGFVLRDAAEATLPPSLVEVWDSRLRRVAAEEVGQRAIAVAALAGPPSIDPDVWRSACREADCEAGTHALEGMLKAGLAVPDARGRWRFAHPLLAEAARGLVEDRSPLHRANAMALAADPAADSAWIGLNRLEAGDAVEALPDLWAALDAGVAKRSAMRRVVISAIERALRESGVPDDDASWGRWWLVRGSTARTLARFDEALSHVTEAEALAREHGWTGVLVDALRDRSILLRVAGRAADALEPAEAALLAARADGDTVRLNEVRLALAEVLVDRGEVERGADLAGPIEADESVDPEVRARATYALGRAVLASLNPLDALPILQRGATRFRALDLRSGEAVCSVLLGNLRKQEGNADEARRLYAAAVRSFERDGSQNALIPRLNIAILDLDAHRWAQAMPELDLLVREMPRAGRVGMGAIAWLALCLARVGLGDDAAADRALEQATEGLQTTGLVEAQIGALALDIAIHSGPGPRRQRAVALARAQGEAIGWHDLLDRIQQLNP